MHRGNDVRRAALVAAVVVLLVGAASANAQTYCGFNPGSYGSCTGSYQSLSKNGTVAQSASWAVCSGALDANGNFYGQYFCASNWSCHTYGGGNLTPISHNHEGFGQRIYGYTNGHVTFTCPRGGPALAGEEARCLTVDDGTAGAGVTCADPDVVAERGLAGVLIGGDATGAERPGTGILHAIAPDGARSATLLRADGGSPRRLTVTDGRVRAALRGDETTLRWDTPVTAPSAPATLAVPLP